MTRGGWTVRVPAGSTLDAEIISRIFAVVEGETPPYARLFRRSRHASTWLARIQPLGDVFIKRLDPLRGWTALVGRLRGRRSARVASIVARLERDRFAVPRLLVIARHRDGHELIATARATGFMLPRVLRELASNRVRRRALLDALGAEVARLHATGYVHGDLTPFNVVIPPLELPRFTFLDHERTRQGVAARFTRARLRNLVQLGHFDFPGVSRTDRMRVWRGYSKSMTRARRRTELWQLVRMLDTRRRRESREIESKLKWSEAAK